MASVFIAGLTPGNSQTERGTREGTLVAVFNYDLWQEDNREPNATLGMAVSDQNGEILIDIGDIPEGTALRIHIRELGFVYLGFVINTDKFGVNYPARLQPDPGIDDDFLRKKYPNSVRHTWDEESEFQKALQKVFRRQAELGGVS